MLHIVEVEHNSKVSIYLGNANITTDTRGDSNIITYYCHWGGSKQKQVIGEPVINIYIKCLGWYSDVAYLCFFTGLKILHSPGDSNIITCSWGDGNMVTYYWGAR